MPCMEIDSALFSATLIVIIVLINVKIYGFAWSFRSLKRPGL